jgi:molybdopterin-containing oxidoreductase family iron-sulfur binding subunit
MSCRKDLSPRLAGLESLASARGKKYWRSLEELSNSDAFRRLIEQEFPSQAAIWPNSLSRRRFLTLMGASLALGGVGGCSVRPAPSTDLVPYVERPEEVVPGRPLFFATTMTIGGDAVGLLAESHMGRPIKVEGNPDHPASLGATSAQHQASVLTLYDPDRAQSVTYLGRERTWDAVSNAIRAAIQGERQQGGAGLRLLTESVVSPTLAEQLKNLLNELPKAKWCVHEPVNRDAAYRGAELAFGQVVSPRYEFARADAVLSLDADFLCDGPGHLRYASDFMARRRVRTTSADAVQAEMNRLYVIESALTCTGAKADHRLAVRGKEIEAFARAIAAKLGAIGAADVAVGHDRLVTAVARDLAAHRGRSLVIAGDRQPPVVHLLAHAMNEHLGSTGQTVAYTSTNELLVEVPHESLAELADEMRQGQVRFLLILGGNPAWTAEAEVPLAKHLERVPLRIHLGLYEDETSHLCHWHLPETHYLEAWSDAQAYDGTASIVQPLVEPLYEGRSAHEVLALLTESQEVAGRDIVRSYWRGRWQQNDSPQDFERRWQSALHDGVIPGTRFEAKDISLANDWQRHLIENAGGVASPASAPDKLELVFLPDPTIYDGRFANNGWLQELPKPITQLTWGNAAIMSPATASRLGTGEGTYAHGGEHGGYHMPVVELRLDGRMVRAPLWVMPGHADGTITVYLGGGRTSAGRVGGTPEEQVGFNAYALRSASAPWFAAGLEVAVTSERELVACTQQHHSMEDRDVVFSATLDEYRRAPDFASREQERERRQKSIGAHEPLTFYKAFDYDPPKRKWGMAIDLTTCIGCNACIVACQSENNIPVVGKEQVAAGREMHWLRVDRYIGGPADEPDAFHFQPLPCMHCENAPCEYVCPVEATVHSAEGLNEMVYNRCVGTRFCSNNCPYKVRRFNFLAYADYQNETLRLQYNPEVTVRSRGVMEKCSYCVQRIRRAEIDAQVEQRGIADGEVLTACQAACPTQAIVFGDINDPASKVRAWKDSPLEYSLLEDLNTAPRTSYLAALRNPNPDLEGT